MTHVAKYYISPLFQCLRAAGENMLGGRLSVTTEGAAGSVFKLQHLKLRVGRVSVSAFRRKDIGPAGRIFSKPGLIWTFGGNLLCNSISRISWWETEPKALLYPGLGKSWREKGHVEWVWCGV